MVSTTVGVVPVEYFVCDGWPSVPGRQRPRYHPATFRP
jgi:hypothetical protein